MTNHTERPATTTSPLAGDDPRMLFARAVSLAHDTIDAVAPEQLHEPTTVGMDVRDLMEHLVMVLRRVACAGRGQPVPSWPADAADVADDRFATAWREAAHDVQAAWTDDGLLEQAIDLPWGTFSGAEVLGTYTNEVTVHTWDLAKATGQEPRWDEAVLAAADASIRAQLPMAARAPMWEAAKTQLPPGVPWETPFADAVEVPDDAAAIDRLVAWNGRRP